MASVDITLYYRHFIAAAHIRCLLVLLSLGLSSFLLMGCPDVADNWASESRC